MLRNEIIRQLVFEVHFEFKHTFVKNFIVI